MDFMEGRNIVVLAIKVVIPKDLSTFHNLTAYFIQLFSL